MRQAIREIGIVKNVVVSGQQKGHKRVFRRENIVYNALQCVLMGWVGIDGQVI